MKIIADVLQGSKEWHDARCGRATASCFGEVLAKGQGKTRASYLRKIVGERLTGKVSESYSNKHMERGQEQEPLARLAYEAANDCFVQQVGFIQHDEIMAGCSPDGLIGKDGGAEIKSAMPHIHVETILSGSYPSEHKAQVQGNLWLSEREWWDFCSYCPDMRDRTRRLYVYRVYRDEPYIKTLETEVRVFLADVERALVQICGQDIEGLLRQSLKEAA